jgi:hypothetical protein
MKVGITNSLLDLLDPLVPLRFGLQVINSSLVGEDQHKRKHDRIVLHEFFHLTLDEHTSQALHVFVLLITLVFVGIQFFAQKDVPVLSVLSSFLLLLDDLSFDVDGVFAFALVAGFLASSHRQTTNAMGHCCSS